MHHPSSFLLSEEQQQPEVSHMIDDKSSEGKLTGGAKVKAKAKGEYFAAWI